MTSPKKSEKPSNSTIQTFKPDNQELSLIKLTNQMISSGDIKTPIEFAKKFMFSLDSEEQFSIDIELLIEWKVYDRKDNIKVKLKKNFILDTDYQVRSLVPELSGARNSKAPQAGKNKEIIMLTIDCFKFMCMLSNNDIGKQVKTYYLDLEKVFKKYMLLQYQEQLQLKDTEILKITNSHNLFLKRRKRDVFEKGNVVYIVSHDAFDLYYKDDYDKIGKATQKTDESVSAFTSRLSTYNTCAPGNYKVHYLIYVDNNSLLENILKEKYKKQLDPTNKEWIKGEKVEDIITFIREVCKLLEMEYKDFEYKTDIMDNINLDKEDMKDDEIEFEIIEDSGDNKSESESESTDLDETDSETESEDDIEKSKENKRYKEILNKLDTYLLKHLREIAKEIKSKYCSNKKDYCNSIKIRVNELRTNMKLCIKCNIKKDNDEFRKTTIGYVLKCKECELSECKKETKYKEFKESEITDEDDTKNCSTCKKLLNLEDFSKNKTRADGYEYNCKNCESKRGQKKENIRLIKKRPKNIKPYHKWCSNCETEKHVDEFFKASKRQDGLQNSCKICDNKTKCKRKLLNKLKTSS